MKTRWLNIWIENWRLFPNISLTLRLRSSCSRNKGRANGGCIGSWGIIISPPGYSQGAWLKSSWKCCTCCSSKKGAFGEIAALVGAGVVEEGSPGCWGPLETPCTFCSTIGTACTFYSTFGAFTSITAGTTAPWDSEGVPRAGAGVFGSDFTWTGSHLSLCWLHLRCSLDR